MSESNTREGERERDRIMQRIRRERERDNAMDVPERMAPSTDPAR